MIPTSIPAWVDGYVGVPFLEFGRSDQGWDCWGLVHVLAARHFGYGVPSYADDYSSADDRAELAALIAGELGPWRPAESHRAGDVVLMRLLGRPCHVGLVIAPGWMIHVERGIDTMVDRYDGDRWGRRVVGVFRHAAVAEGQKKGEAA